MNALTDRRTFLQGAASVAAVGILPGLLSGAEESKPKRKFRKAVKYGMIKDGKTVREKFELIKSIGFEGVEVTAPGEVSKQEALEASKATGIVIHGTIGAIHWQSRLSDPDPAVREKGLQALLGALDEAKFYGASTTLLVPGKVTNEKTENFQQVWDRSTEQIKKAIPRAKELGVHIAVEVVWNDFLTNPDLMLKYVDQFDDPIVGAYVDPSNVLRYGKDTNTRGADWIRKLGKRVLKFDFKGYSHEKGFNVPIGEGDEHWPDVLKALDEVGYKDPSTGGPGWATAEVKAGDRAFLTDVSARMDKVLGMT